MSAAKPEVAAKPGGKKKLLIIVGAAVLLLGGGGAGGAYFMGWLGGGEKHGAEAADHGEADAHAEDDGGHAADDGAEAEGHGEAGDGHGATGAVDPAEEAFVDIPDIIVNLMADGRRMRFLKLRLALEVPNQAAKEAVARLMPRVMDSFQMYLRALTVEEVQGAVGIQRIKEEMVARINVALAPRRVDDVLIKEMLVQ